MVINKGDRFIALDNFYMDGDVEKKELKYKKGKEYVCEVNDCITNEQGNKNHCWVSFSEETLKMFKRSNEKEALRYNDSKPQYSLLDLASLEDTVKVLEFGANKYARDNWKKGLQFSQVLDSMMRHIKGLQSGEWIDPESLLPHIGHIGCNAMFLGSKTNKMDLDNLKEEFEKWQNS